MRPVGGALLAAATAGIFLLNAVAVGAAGVPAGRSHVRPRVLTDGRLRPGHLETIRLRGFPGKGVARVSFLPTAICEDSCGGREFQGARTDARGAAKFAVHMPGTFLDRRNRPVYFRDGERVDVEVTWEGSGRSFATGTAEPEPIIVRSHGSQTGAATASTSAPRRAALPEQLPIPEAFQLPASNGYTFFVLGQPARAGQPASLLITVFRQGERVTYSAPASVSETSMQANLGELGEISVAFQRSGQPASISCRRRKISFDSGSWVGRIDFHGEEGFSSVEAVRAPGDVELLARELCLRASVVTSSGPGRGAVLSVRNPALGARMSVGDSRPGGRAWISASTLEFTDGIAIERSTSLRMPGADFTYDRHLTTATVHPPPPFSGSGRFDLVEKAGRRWSGDLTVDLPGRSGTPLTGPSLRATLGRSE